MIVRPSRDETMFAIAEVAALRSTCPAARVGAVIVRDGVLVASGYNGAPRGMAHCDDAGCVVIEKTTTSREYSRHVHAEANAILHCARDGRSTDGCDIYITTFPCLDCAKLIIQAGITRVLVTTAEAPRTEAQRAVAAFLCEGGVDVRVVEVPLRLASLYQGSPWFRDADDRPIRPTTDEELAETKAGAVLAALAAIRQERGPGAVTRAAVAETLGIGADTATRYLRWLEARGLVRRRRHRTGGSGRPRDVYEAARPD